MTASLSALLSRRRLWCPPPTRLLLPLRQSLNASLSPNRNRGPGVPVLGMIPAVGAWRGSERALLRRDQPTSPAAEAYRALAATIQRILPHRPLRSLVVTSPGRGDGRTTVVANLGIVLARAGR